MKKVRSKLFILAIVSFIVMLFCGVMIPSIRQSPFQTAMIAVLMVSMATFLVSCVTGIVFFFIGLLRKKHTPSQPE